MLFIGDDWAEDHHDLEIEDGTVAGSHGLGCLRDWRASPGYTRWWLNTPPRAGSIWRRSRSLLR